MKLLIVEDEQGIVEFVKPSLEAAHCIVDVATDGEEGLRYAKTNSYDAILLDNMLPKKSGVEVCKDLRAAKIDTPILMLSVLSDTKTKVELLQAGADDYLTKPFSFEELLARLKAITRRPKVVEPEELTVDDLQLNTTAYTVYRGGKEIYLTKKEFMLLEYLLRNKGMVLSRGMIMEHVWDINADPFSNTIESHILTLRKKIDTKDFKKLIHTVPGRGYKIDISEAR